MAENKQRPFAPEANALSRLSYGRTANSVANATTSELYGSIVQLPSATFSSPIQQDLDSNRTACIPLTCGLVAMVDAADLDLLSGYSWHATKGKSGGWYAKACIRGSGIGGGKTREIRMHRLITGARPDQDVDHRDGDTLNNRRSNLRPCTHQQNLHNGGPTKKNRSGFRGVSFHRGARKYRATLKDGGKQIHIGFFTVAADAGRAYDAVAFERYGEFAGLNFPRSAPCT